MIRNWSWVNPSVFRVLDAKRGPRTMNLSYRFYYRAEPSASAFWLQVCCRCVDAFLRDWSGKDKWISFPVGLVEVVQDIFGVWFGILCCVPYVAYFVSDLAYCSCVCEPDLAYFSSWFGFFSSLIWLIFERDSVCFKSFWCQFVLGLYYNYFNSSLRRYFAQRLSYPMFFLFS